MSENGFLRLPQILKLIPIGKSTLLEKVKKGEFPKQIKLGAKISVWKASDVQAYIDDHCRASNGNEVRHG
ncbi:hypothetical protein FACS189472_17040 [Alphaproteobacteria bacterium]|nr:hypothetical protein FACS189472_17040 [Alphaproteobacteria bacterium]